MKAGAAKDALAAEELFRGEFEALEAEWDSLLARGGQDQPFVRHSFVKAWLDNFAPGAPVRLFAAREGGRLVAVLPLLEDQAWLWGVPVRRMRAPVNVHSCRFDVACEAERPDAMAALWSHLRASASFDVLELPDVPSGGRAHPLLECASRDGWGVEAWESMRSPYIPLDGGFDAVVAQTDPHFRQNLRRRGRKLAERGTVEVQRYRGGAELERYLEEGFALERSGWKGRRGTAIGQDLAARGFYAEWARRASLEGELSLFFLRLSGEAVAFQLGVEAKGIYYLPKMAYAETHAECSPGQLLMEAVLRDICGRSLTRFDFLGPQMPWKREWAPHARVHQWLYAFAPTARGRLARALKFRWGPRAQEVVGWKR